ncbi:MAG: hypothetical protein FADNKDHG_01359 [Holosporales bacterium]
MNIKLLTVTVFLSTFVFCSSSPVIGRMSIDWKGSHFSGINLSTIRTFVSDLEIEEYNSKKARHCDENGNFVIDYSRMRVCDVKSSDTSHYSEVFDKIRQLFWMVDTSQPILMNFSGNYLTDDGVSALVDFILQNQPLKNQLKVLNLSNNRFGSSALIKLRPFVEQCPRLEKVNISINLISNTEVNQAFQGVPASKIYFAPY